MGKNLKKKKYIYIYIYVYNLITLLTPEANTTL